MGQWERSASLWKAIKFTSTAPLKEALPVAGQCSWLAPQSPPGPALAEISKQSASLQRSTKGPSSGYFRRSASRWKTVKEGFLERDWGKRFGLESGKGGALLLGCSARSASPFPATPFTTAPRIPRPLPSRWSPRKNTEAEALPSSKPSSGEALPFGKTKKFAGGRPF